LLFGSLTTFTTAISSIVSLNLLLWVQKNGVDDIGEVSLVFFLELLVKSHYFYRDFIDINPVLTLKSFASEVRIVRENSLNHGSHLLLGVDRNAIGAVVHDRVGKLVEVERSANY
jgi:hypothetical protein